MKHFDRYKANVSHVTQSNNRKTYQMDVNVEGNLFAKFHKDERNISPWNQNPLNSWLSQALTHTSAHYLQLYRKDKHGDPYFSSLF